MCPGVAGSTSDIDDRLGIGSGPHANEIRCAAYLTGASRGTMFVVIRFVSFRIHLRPVLALLFLMDIPSMCQEWRDYSPSLRSQVVKLQISSADSLLSDFCIATEQRERFGYTCRTRWSGTGFADITSGVFHAQGVIFGHFLDAHTTDAAISGSSYESHPYHWGGTLLLTQRDKKWIPVWYKSGLITRSCEKASRPDGREILICEIEDGGMGHRYHSLYVVDLLRQPAARPLGHDFCSAQRQIMEALTWDSDYRSFSVVIRTPEWYSLPQGVCGPHPPKRPPLSQRLEFHITEDGIRPRVSN